MFKVILTILSANLVYSLSNDPDIVPNKTYIHDLYKYDHRIILNVNNTVEHILDFYEESDLWRGYPSRVHVSTNNTPNLDYPVFITAELQKAVSSWELPLVISTNSWTMIFNDMGRTLCPHDAGTDIKIEKRPTIHISTANPANASVDIKLKRVTDFYVEVDKEVRLNITPSTPKYFFFSFDQNHGNATSARSRGLPIFNYTVPKSVILTIDSGDDLCATVSIQNNSCPVFDNEQDVYYKGYHLTMSSKGGITLTQSMFPHGFYVVFIVRESDIACTGGTSGSRDLESDGRTKSIRFRVVATISYKEYVIGALVSLALVALVPVFALTVLTAGSKCKEEVTVPVVEEGPGTSSSVPAGETEPGPSGVPPDGANESEYSNWWETDKGPTDEHQPLDTSDRTNALEDSLFGAHALTVAALTRAPADTLARRSSRYFWSTVTVAIIYALPVMQLLFTYQGLVFQTGDQDLCYYNFLCAHPLGYLSDFNHVYSNIGYVLLGAVFMLQVRARQRTTKNQPADLGIPQHYGLLYAMGLALTMEGIFSACYHLCPNKMNFQFDSSFMYMIALLVMIKLYHNRHSDIVPSAQSTFMLLAFVMAIGVFGIVYRSVWFSVLFSVLHLLTCFVFTMKIYYTGKFTVEVSAITRAWVIVRTERAKAFIPAYTARAVMLILANVANWAFALTTAYEHSKDFARELLAILMGNAVMYMVFYIVMKLVHREKILGHTWVYIAVTAVAWFAGLFFFMDSKTKWSETPASSRRHNAPCSALQFYDSHDLWHAASAAGMYFAFNMLLTVDDALAATPRDKIPTF